MKKAIVFTFVMLVAGIAIAADIAKDPNVTVEGSYRPGIKLINNDRATIAVLSMYEGTFLDLSAYYLDGMTAAGHVADYYPDPLGGIDYSGYDLVLVSSSDNWWGSDYSTEIPVLSSYMDAGGKCIIVGQDWLWGSGDYKFAEDYLGMSSAIEEINAMDDGPLDWTGTAGGPLEGLSGSISPCFESNLWFTDQIDATTQGLADWRSPTSPDTRSGGCVGANGMLSSIEFGCGSDVVGKLLSWWLTTASEESNFSEVKSRY